MEIHVILFGLGEIKMKLGKGLQIIMVIVLAFSIFSGCAAKSKYVEPAEVRDNPALSFNPNDLQMLAERMAQSLIDTDIFTGKEKPIIRITELRNKTSEHIDTKAITDKVRTALVKSRKVRFVSDKKEDYARQDQLNEFKDQNNPDGLGAFMDESAKLKIGKMKGPKFHLFGEIVSISNSSSDGKDVYYKMTLNLLNLEEGLLDWSEEKELRKIKEKRLFGF
jgi:penicillin-binding protein activator